MGSPRGGRNARKDASLRWRDGWPLGALWLAACHPAPDTNETAAAAPPVANAQTPADARIPCATGGAARLTLVCTIDRETTPRGTVLTLRQPDGGFHRLLVTTDGRGVTAADGAQRASVTIVGPDAIEVRVGDDRYRLPATIGKPGA